MHQNTRVPPRLSSPASSPQTNPLRTNNPREATSGPHPPSRSATMPSPASAYAAYSALPAESTKKLDQIVQNFHTKAASLVIGSRMKVRPVRCADGTSKMNRWYQLETEEMDDFREELRIWRNCGGFENRPPPMIIEVYLDASNLKESQSLVIIDENGKRWDVLEQLNASPSLHESDSSGTGPKPAEVILERWRVELKMSSHVPADDFGPILPTIYKKAIVFFRSLFVTTRLLPVWKFTSQGIVKNSHPCLSPRCRIRSSDVDRRGPDLLRSPIDGRREPVTEYMFGDLEVPVGRLTTSVIYRNDCNFRVDDSESLLSSRFMGVDEHFFKPSLPPRLETKRVGSLRDHRRHHSLSEAHQTYGSLSTFHGENALSTSPMSALRAVKPPPESDTASPTASMPSYGAAAGAAASAAVPYSLPISARTSMTRLRTDDDSRRRPSISFQPFKAGSLSDSPVPRHSEPESPASANSLTRPGGLPALYQARNRSSLTAGMPASLRGGPPAPAAAVDTSVAGSPRPASASRYSSSFSHRRSRPSLGGASKTGDEDNSSGRQSLSSSVIQPGSGLLAEIGAASYSSLQTDEDDISDFLKALDSKKTLKSFEPTRKGESATSRTVAQLSKFQMMRESHAALTDSMTSSSQLQRSSVSSRQLANVAGTSTSPGKPASPHTAHTPAIPSRLSENSIISYAPSFGGRTSPRGRDAQPSRASESNKRDGGSQDGATAIDIPLSPRIGFYPRRPSSVAQQQVRTADEDEADLPFATHRSISLGASDREAPTLSVLLGRQGQAGNEEGIAAQRNLPSRLRPAAEMETTGTSGVDAPRGSVEDTPPSSLIPPVQPGSPYQRRRYAGLSSGAARRPTPPQSSRGSFTGSSSRVGRAEDEGMSEEPLVFTLSEMDALGRRSVEEGRSGSTHGSDRPAFEPRGITRRGWA